MKLHGSQVTYDLLSSCEEFLPCHEGSLTSMASYSIVFAELMLLAVRAGETTATACTELDVDVDMDVQVQG
ncbi:hypothetical protein LIER_25696 [Lithospermum erythrorhizon]|uniref:Uncharacterized protein n=1 Tax=Lithospermum erythrorhizon TaxID=34254 RepID=A0AAV3R782_LITER